MNNDAQQTTNDNLVTHLTRVNLITAKSQKTGNDYTALELHWLKPSGSIYKQRVFPNTEAISIIEDTVPVPGSNSLGNMPQA